MKLITKHEQKLIEEEMMILVDVFKTAMECATMNTNDDKLLSFAEEVFHAGAADILQKVCGNNAVERLNELEEGDD